jgi:hypothetical protein
MAPVQVHGVAPEPGVTRGDHQRREIEHALPGLRRQPTAQRLRPSAVPLGSAASAVGRLELSATGRRSTGAGPGALELRDPPGPEAEVAHLQTGGGGSGSAALQTPPPPVVTPRAPTAAMALSGNSYSDTASESHKNVTYTATWSGGAKEDFLIVQWVKGYAKDAAGTPLKTTQYNKTADINFADWRIDSVDEDPAYWSNASGRWNYNVVSANSFSATDDPNPPSWQDGMDFKVDFKVGVYKAADVPTTTTGTMAATPLSSLVPWEFHAKLSGGKFTH